MPSSTNTRDTAPPPARSVLITLLVIAALTACACLMPRSNPDLDWQLRVGSDILRNHALPFHDRYSWTRYGAAWIAPEWIFFVLSSWVYTHLGGMGGIWLETVVLSIILMTLLGWIVIHRSGSALLGGCLAVLSLCAITDFLTPRPQMFSYIALAAVSAVLTSERRPYHLLPVIFLVWANLHQAVIAGLIAAAVLAYGDLMQGAWIKSKGDLERGSVYLADFKSASLWLAVSAVATLITPYGYRMYAQAIGTVRDSGAMSYVSDWAPLTPSSLYEFWAFTGLMIAVLASFLFSGRPKRIGEILVVLLLASQTYLHLRDAPLCSVFAAVAAAPWLGSWAKRTETQFPGRWATPAIGGLLIALAAPTVILNIGMAREAFQSPEITPLRPGTLMNAIGPYPAEAAEFLAREQFPASLRMFNSYSLGGYLIGMSPERRVFIDGRADLYLDGLLSEYFAANTSDSPTDCVDLMEKYGCDFAVVSSDPEYLSLAASPDWTLVYAEHLHDRRPFYRRTWIFVRKRPELAALIARCRRDCPEAVQVSGGG